MRALVLVLRYTGLRISDAIGCPLERLRDGKIWLYTHKTGQHVYCPLPEFVVKELESIPRVSERYWFWTGKGSLETARKKWSESRSTLFEEAKVEGGHAHRFRDTFATELLLSGTPIESVSAFLGHSSIRVTERHYTPWLGRGKNKLRRTCSAGGQAIRWSLWRAVLVPPKVQIRYKLRRRLSTK